MNKYGHRVFGKGKKPDRAKHMAGMAPGLAVASLGIHTMGGPGIAPKVVGAGLVAGGVKGSWTMSDRIANKRNAKTGIRTSSPAPVKPGNRVRKK